MDRESVENLANWKIGRSTSSQPGQIYNFGLVDTVNRNTGESPAR